MQRCKDAFGICDSIINIVTSDRLSDKAELSVALPHRTALPRQAGSQFISLLQSAGCEEWIVGMGMGM